MPAQLSLRRRLAAPALALALLGLPAAGGVAQAAVVTTTPALDPAFSNAVPDYVVRCEPSDTVQVDVTPAAGETVAVDGGAAQATPFSQTVGLQPGQRFPIVVTGPGGTVTHEVRCLPADFPTYTAARSGPTQAAYYIVTPNQYLPPFGVSGRYVAIFDAHGVPVWWLRSASTPLPTDGTLLSNGNIAFTFEWPAPAGAEERRLDGTLVHHFNAVGGNENHHDILLLANGDYLVGRVVVRQGVDMSACGGSTSRQLVDFELQEITPSGSLVWSWRASDHIPFSEVGATWRNECTTGSGDIYHWNSVEPDGNGYVLSFRHLDAVYRIDRATGNIDWKLGGTPRPESLTVLGDPSHTGTQTFSAQHDARVLPDGTLTVFDDGSGVFGRAPRAVRYAIDPIARTATLVESMTNPAAHYSGCCGSARRLPAGDWVVSWGDTPYITEQQPSGKVVLQLSFAKVFSYRAVPVLPGQLTRARLRAGMDAMHPR